MISFLMIGSLVLGLIAWTLPFINLRLFKKHKNRNRVASSILSMSACAISLCFQIFYNNHLVKLEAWADLMDTAGTSTFLSIVLLVGTIILNTLNLIADPL